MNSHDNLRESSMTMFWLYFIFIPLQDSILFESKISDFFNMWTDQGVTNSELFPLLCGSYCGWGTVFIMMSIDLIKLHLWFVISMFFSLYPHDIMKHQFIFSTYKVNHFRINDVVSSSFPRGTKDEHFGPLPFWRNEDNHILIHVLFTTFSVY